MASGFDSEKARSDFLVAMYNQLMNDINRHIVVVWQSVTALLSAFAVWSLVEKKTISLDIAVSLIIGVAIWVLMHVYDAAYWYNRNLVIIANIERQFLKISDLREVHYYWGEHRASGSMLTHLKLQLCLAVGIAALVFGIHFSDVIAPLIPQQFSGAKFQNFLPLGSAVLGVLVWLRRRYVVSKKYSEFLENSPGRTVDTTGIRYGMGHPSSKQ
jgi:hypothetical protein